MLIAQIEQSKNKAGGSAQEIIDIEVPRNAVRIFFFVKHIGAAAVENALYPRVEAKTTDADFSTTYNTAIFNNSGLAAGTASLGTSNGYMAMSKLRWQIQAHAATATQFFLRIKFFDV